MVNIVFLRVLSALTWRVFASYLVLNIACSQRLSRSILKAFSVPANTVSGDKLFKWLKLLVQTCAYRII